MSHQVQAHEVRFDRFEEWFIKRQAQKLVADAGFPADEIEDIQQEMRLYILQRMLRFDKDKSARHTYVVMAVRYCTTMLVRQRYAAKRNSGKPLQSLDDTVFDQDGQEADFHEMLDRDARRTTDGDREREERQDLILDVRRVVASLPEHLRQWCAILGELGIREASRKFHIPLTRLRQIKAEIHTAFKAAGLGAYLPQK